MAHLPAGTVLASGEIHLAGRLRTIEWRETSAESRVLSEALQSGQGSQRATRSEPPTFAKGATSATKPLQDVAAIDLPGLDSSTWSDVAAGIDWLTELHCSGACSGTIFKSVTSELGSDLPRQPEVRRTLDAHMHAWFEHQRAMGNSPVAETDARNEVMKTIESTLKFH